MVRMNFIDEERDISSVDEYIELLNTLSAKTHYSIYDAKCGISNITIRDDIYTDTRNIFNKALLYLIKAKWYLGRASGTSMYIAPMTRSWQDCEKSHVWFDAARTIAEKIVADLAGSSGPSIAADEALLSAPTLTSHGEIAFADDVPIVPSISPIVVLEGSSREMGRQYAEQVVEIFGSWIFEQIASRSFSLEQTEQIRRWERHLLDHTPEIAEMAHGWVEGAQALGIHLSYLHVIQLWTGHFDPVYSGILPHGVRDLVEQISESDSGLASTSYMGGLERSSVSSDGQERQLPSVEMCSGCCAWGSATVDGNLITGSTTDHDCTFQATVAAFPDTGYSFIYTPFSVTGFIPGLGQYYFAGHPGMNNQGLAYVHHGGGLHAIEPGEKRGYGLRRGVSTFHNLRFANSAAQAFKNELSWPIGDVGSILGSVGGFYADKTGGYVIEARAGADGGGDPIVRHHASDGKHSFDFLYANNNSIHPQSSNGFLPPEGGYQYDPVEGWFAERPFSAYPSTNVPGIAAALSTRSSQGRNRYMFESLKVRNGAIDLSEMVAIFRTGAPERFDADGVPLTHAQKEIAWAGGAKWPSSTTHRLNAFTAVMAPDRGDQGLYLGCIGPGNGRASMHTPGHGYSYYDEPNEFWQIRLAVTPYEMARTAEELADYLIGKAADAISICRAHLLPAAVEMLEAIRDKASDDLVKAKEELPTSNGDVAIIARALRASTRAQVRAQQILRELADGGFIRWNGLHDRKKITAVAL